LSVRKQAGFTLIEMIAVLAVIAILAAVIAPPIIEQINRAVADSETQNLDAIAQGLEEYIKDKKIIPAAGSWAADVATVLPIPASKITSNERNFTRGYYVDPNFSPALPYTQDAGNIALPVSPRIMIVSDLTANALGALSNFNATWDQTADKDLTEGPNVKIKRMHLGHLFHHVLLSNLQGPPAPPSYRIETGTQPNVPTGSLDLYVLDGSKLSLFLHTGGLNDALLVLADESPLYYTPDAGSTWLWKRQ